MRGAKSLLQQIIGSALMDILEIHQWGYSVLMSRKIFTSLVSYIISAESIDKSNENSHS